MVMKVLIVEDDPDMLQTCSRLLKRAGYRTAVAPSGESAVKELDDGVDLVLTDLKMPGPVDGIGLLKWIKKNKPGLPVIMMTGFGTVETAVEAMKAGASDYIAKPVTREGLLAAVARFAKVQKLESEVKKLRQQIRQTATGLDSIIGKSAGMRGVIEKIEAAARVDSPVLIVGESGTGKEIVARAIHERSPRSKAPFIAINCGALPRELIESELFGHKKGSFTSASSDHDGVFVAAGNGTLFLDEIGEMAPSAQVKLLRALQERTIRAVGDTVEKPVSARILSATNQNIDAALKSGVLREDLYYRLSVITIALPPLRERPDDVPLLVNHFIEKFNALFNRSVKGVAPDAMQILQSHAWPGNVRQLENVLEGCYAMGAEGLIQATALPATLRVENASQSGRVPSMVESEKKLVEQALAASKGNKSEAARLLGISRTRLYKKLDLYGIEE